MKRPIWDMLTQECHQNDISFHMPGHKGKSSIYDCSFIKYDITELGYSDNLYNPESVIRESQECFASYLNAGQIFYLVNGSSCGVISSILSVSGLNKILFARNLHVSAVSGMILSGVSPKFIYGDEDGFISEYHIIKALEDNKDVDAVFLTYPDYSGRCFNLKKVCDIAHKLGVLVVVDSAHGASFSFSDLLPLDCGSAGVDIWTISTHKTLSSLNQSAILCISKNFKFGYRIKSFINLIQTTSPSYPILASIESSLAELVERGTLLYKNLYDLIQEFYHSVSQNTTVIVEKYDNDYDYDFTKISISSSLMDGISLSHILEKSKIYVECFDKKNVLLLTSVNNCRGDFMKLNDVLNKLNSFTKVKAVDDTISLGFSDNVVLPPREAFLSESELVNLDNSLNRICGVPVGCYPPGIPILIPGDLIESCHIEYLNKMSSYGYDLFGLNNNMISVVKE